MQTQTVLRILVADPDSTLASLLEERGFEVTSVRSGTSTLERGAERQFDIFLIHYALSDLNGGIVVDNLTQYSWKKRPLILLYSREATPQLKKHSEGKFPADIYLEGRSRVSEIPEIINQKVSGKEIKSKFLDTSTSPNTSCPAQSASGISSSRDDIVGIASEAKQSARHCERSEAISREEIASSGLRPPRNDESSFIASSDLRPPRNDESSLFHGDNQEELTILSRELEIAHRELNELSSRLDNTTKELKELKEIKVERDSLKLMLQRVKTSLDEEVKRSKILENENCEFRKRYENLRERAKEDLRILKEREGKFASQVFEIKRDAEKLIQTKDQKILLLKREFEEIKFELERRGEKLQLSKERIEYWKHRVGKVTKALKVAMNVLENEEGGQII